MKNKKPTLVSRLVVFSMVLLVVPLWAVLVPLEIAFRVARELIMSVLWCALSGFILAQALWHIFNGNRDKLELLMKRFNRVGKMLGGTCRGA